MDFRRTAYAPSRSRLHRTACLSIAHLYCPHHIGKRATIAALAQLVEHRIRNAGVVGSNPISGTICHFLLFRTLPMKAPVLTGQPRSTYCFAARINL